METNEPHQTLVPEMPAAAQAPPTSQAPPAPGTPPPGGYAPVPPRSPLERFMPLFIAAGAVFLGILVFVVFQQLRAKPPIVQVAPTPTHTPSPTPLRQLSQLASQSGFLSLEQEVASLSAKINSYSVQDPSLSPPELTLPLGF